MPEDNDAHSPSIEEYEARAMLLGMTYNHIARCFYVMSDYNVVLDKLLDQDTLEPITNDEARARVNDYIARNDLRS